MSTCHPWLMDFLLSSKLSAAIDEDGREWRTMPFEAKAELLRAHLNNAGLCQRGGEMEIRRDWFGLGAGITIKVEDTPPPRSRGPYSGPGFAMYRKREEEKARLAALPAEEREALEKKAEEEKQREEFAKQEAEAMKRELESWAVAEERRSKLDRSERAVEAVSGGNEADFDTARQALTDARVRARQKLDTFTEWFWIGPSGRHVQVFAKGRDSDPWDDGRGFGFSGFWTY